MISQLKVDSEILCMNVFKLIRTKYDDHAGAADFSEEDRPVIIVLTVIGIIGNGGFHCLFESLLPGDPKYAYTIKAFEDIGCFKVVEIIKKNLSLFPNGDIPLNNEERIKLFEMSSEAIRRNLNQEFWAEDDNIIINLAKYIKERGLDRQ